MKETAGKKVRLTILSENYTPFSLGLGGEHGFSVFIEKDGKSYLYDAGQHGVAALNAIALGCSLKKVRKIFLSHGHVDHTGGLPAVLEAIGRPVIIAGHPAIFGKKYVDRGGNTYIGMPLDAKELEKDFKVKFDLWKGLHEFEKGVWLTGEIPITNSFEKMPDHFKLKRGNKMVKDDFCDDNALVIEVRGGIVIVTGCGHRGIVNIVTYVKKVMGKRLVGLLGGTHLHEAEAEHKDEVVKSLKKIFEEDRTKVFAPAHCTGFDTIHSFGEEFKDILKPAFCGTKFEF